MDIHIVHLPDLHLGHSKVSTADTYERLHKFAFPEIEKCNLLVFGGDYFNESIALNSDAGYYAILIMDEIIQLAMKHQFYIRVVRGTTFHDRKQNRLFLRYSKLMINGLPLIRYFDTVSVETDLLGMDLLYIPDDLPYDNVMDHIKEVMNKVHVPSVDLVISHGYFKHLLPIGIPREPKNTLDWNLLKPFVHGCVLNGHVHIPSVYERVVSGGSFERMQHGEEHDKGFFTIQYNLKTHSVHFDFHINTEALLFKTIRLDKSSELNVELYKNKLKKILEKANKNAPLHLRIIIDDQNLKQSLIEYTKNAYPEYNLFFTSQKISDPDEYSSEEEVDLEDAELPVITEENLPELLLQFLEKQEDFSVSIDEIRQILQSAKKIRRI